MRNIRFRGKAINRKGTWLIGDLRQDLKANEFWIFPYDEHPGVDKHRVDPKTIGQFIGLKDKDGKEIFEGDFIDGFFQWGVAAGLVEFDSDIAAFATKEPDDIMLDSLEILNYKVVGNIHDNPNYLTDQFNQTI